MPSRHLTTIAQRTLSVDAELSPLVRRALSIVKPPNSNPAEAEVALLVNYAATTNRMLRVAVNGFIESIGVVIGVMKDLDIDVVYDDQNETLDGVQGLVSEGERPKE